jgi:hypothetical protein
MQWASFVGGALVRIRAALASLFSTLRLRLRLCLRLRLRLCLLLLLLLRLCLLLLLLWRLLLRLRRLRLLRRQLRRRRRRLCERRPRHAKQCRPVGRKGMVDTHRRVVGPSRGRVRLVAEPSLLRLGEGRLEPREGVGVIVRKERLFLLEGYQTLLALPDRPPARKHQRVP